MAKEKIIARKFDTASATSTGAAPIKSSSLTRSRIG
jgi:hypothetical protein